MKRLTISQAARAAGVGVETIRFYERRQLIDQPTKQAGAGPRSYSDAIVRRVRFIKEAQQLGFSLQEARELLTLRSDPAAECSDVRDLATTKLDDVRDKIRRLAAMEAALERLVQACPGCGSLDHCSIMDALIPGRPESRAREADQTLSNAEGTHGLKTMTFTIEGMRCDACAEKVRQLLSREAGVNAVSVNLAERQARVLYEPEKTNPDKLSATIEKPGYRVVEQR